MTALAAGAEPRPAACSSPPSSARRSRTARLGAARRQRGLRQDRGDGRAVRGGGAAATASPSASILALTFTEKAAGELRERIRRRFTALGEDEHAREARGRMDRHDPRLLRARAAGAAARGRPGPALHRARRGGGAPARRARRTTARSRHGRRRAGAPAVDLAAAYGPALRDDPARRARDAAQPRRRSHPRLPIPPPRRGARRGRARRRARRRGRRARASSPTARRSRPRARRSTALALAGEGDEVPWPGALDAAKLGDGAKALERSAPARPTARRGRPTARPAPTTTPAPRSCCSTTCSTASARPTTRRRRRARAWTSPTSSCGCATCSADPRRATRWAERFELIMVDEFQDTNRLQLDVLEALDARQPVRGRRRVPVDLPLPPRRRDDLPRAAGARSAPARVRRLARNFRSGEELLDVLNGAFAPELGDRFTPLVAGASRAATARCGCSIPIPRPASRRSSCCSPTRAAGTSPSSSARSGSPGSPRSRGGAPRRGWWRTACGRRSTTAGGPGTSSCSCARRRRCGCSSRRSRSRACRRTWSAAAATGRRSRSATGSPTCAALANPHDEEALLAVLSSPFCGVGTDALVLLPGRPRERARHVGGAARRPRARTGSSTCPTTSAGGCGVRARVRRRAPAGRARRRSRCCSSARSSPPATTSPCSPAPAGSGGWRTCAS